MHRVNRVSFCVCCLVDNNDTFHPYTGEVALSPSSLNYELMSEYELFFKVSDPSGLDDYVNITVPITDVNEKPVIQNLPDDAYIAEGSTGSFSVFDVNTIDVDGDSLTYSIFITPVSSSFYISSGELIWDWYQLYI